VDALEQAILVGHDLLQLGLDALVEGLECLFVATEGGHRSPAPLVNEFVALDRKRIVGRTDDLPYTLGSRECNDGTITARELDPFGRSILVGILLLLLESLYKF